MDESGRWPSIVIRREDPHIVFPGWLSGQEAVGGKSFSPRVQSRIELTCKQLVLLFVTQLEKQISLIKEMLWITYLLCQLYPFVLMGNASIKILL